MTLSGSLLKDSCKENFYEKKRDFVTKLVRMFEDSQPGCYLLCGPVGAGKTVGILQAIQEVNDYSRFIYIQLLDDNDEDYAYEVLNRASKASHQWVIFDNANRIDNLYGIHSKAESFGIKVLLCDTAFERLSYPTLRVGFLRYHETDYYGVVGLAQYLESNALYDKHTNPVDCIIKAMRAKDDLNLPVEVYLDAVQTLCNLFTYYNGVVYSSSLRTGQAVIAYDSFCKLISGWGREFIELLLQVSVDVGFVYKLLVVDSTDCVYVAAVPSLVKDAINKQEYLVYSCATEYCNLYDSVEVAVDDYANIFIVRKNEEDAKVTIINTASGVAKGSACGLSLPNSEYVEISFCNTAEMFLDFVKGGQILIG